MAVWKYYAYASVVLGLDQLSKWMIVQSMQLGESRAVWGDFFQLTSHRNRGAAFGILQDQRWLFLFLTIVVMAGIVYYMNQVVREGKKRLPTALGLLLGGAIGNFVDRALSGEVVDFMHFRFQFTWFGEAIDYSYPIFNVADVAICVGVGLFILDTFVSSKKERSTQHEQANERV